MAYKKTVEIDVYRCPGCDAELRLAVMKKEGKLCPTCQGASDKQLTISYWQWVLGCRVVGIDVTNYNPDRLNSIILELPDESLRRIYPRGYQDMSYSEWDPEWEISKQVEDEPDAS